MTKQRPVDYLLGHSEPIIDCTALSRGGSTGGSTMYVVSGDRFGEMKIYDMSNCEAVTTISRKMANNGQLTALCSLDDGHSFVYGGTDGRVRVCDIRQDNSVVCTIAAHIERAAAAVTGMATSQNSEKESLTPPRRSLKPSRLSAHSSAARASPNTAASSSSQLLDVHHNSSGITYLYYICIYLYMFIYVYRIIILYIMSSSSSLLCYYRYSRNHVKSECHDLFIPRFA